MPPNRDGVGREWRQWRDLMQEWRGKLTQETVSLADQVKELSEEKEKLAQDLFDLRRETLEGKCVAESVALAKLTTEMRIKSGTWGAIAGLIPFALWLIKQLFDKMMAHGVGP